MLRPVTFFVLSTVLFVAPALAQDPAAPAELSSDAAAQSEDGKSVRDKASFLFGFRMMTQMKSQGADFNLDFVLEGMKLAMSGGEPDISDEEAQSVLQAFEKMARANKIKLDAAEATANLESGTAFLKENGTREGVEQLEGGIQYEVIKSGPEGGASPGKEDRVRVFYTGMHTDGKQFDSSGDEEPAEFAVSGVIRGFTAALSAMKTGDKWKVVIPAELAYGQRGAPPRIGPNETLIFEIELVEIKKQDPGDQ